MTTQKRNYVLAAVLLMLSFACSIPAPAPPTVAPLTQPVVSTPFSTQIEDRDVPDSALLKFLRYIPDTEGYRQWLAYGDAAVWYQSWGITRPDSVEALKNLDPEQKPYIQQILPMQTIPPDSLRTEYLLSEDQRDMFGFDLLNIDRYMEAGYPPHAITVVEFSFPNQKIEDALTKQGYHSQKLDTGMLYYIRKDYEIDAKSPIRTNQLANLNRIFILDQYLIIGSATDIMQKSVDAYSNQIPSLAGNDEYLAAVLALEDDILDDKGNLIGAVFMDSEMFSNLGPIPDSYHQKPLHAFDMAIFATLQKANTAYLVLVLVFPNGIDAQSAAGVIAERLKDYTSLRYKGKLDDCWTFEEANGIEANGLPVALVVMRAEASKPKEISPNIYGVTIWRWIDMIEARDLLFLISEP